MKKLLAFNNTIIKTICITLFLLILVYSSFAQNTYYVSSNGSDTNTGLNENMPLQTISAVNSLMNQFQSGDKILFKRGDFFYGSLDIKVGGLNIGAYGNGDKPQLIGGIKINNGWVSHSTNIWKRELTSSEAPNRITNLYHENNRLPIGRHPNLDSPEKGYYKFESAIGITKLIDNDLDNTVDWTGSEIVVKVYEYRFSKTKVLSHIGKELNLAFGLETHELKAHSGYFFTNNVKTLDQEGEWAYDATSKSIFLYSETNPNEKVYTYTYNDYVIGINGASNVTVNDLDVRLGKEANINIFNSNNIHLSGLKIQDAGTNGILIRQSGNVHILDNVLNRNNLRGVDVRFSSNIYAIKNEFYNIGTDAAYGGEKGLFAIYNESNGSHFIQNRFENVGGAAIVTGGKNVIVKNNYVNNALMLIDDMGAIYTNNNLGGLTTEGTLIEGNIVTNCHGEYWSSYSNKSWVHGIYLDNSSSTVTVRNNTVSNIASTCYFLHRPTYLTIFDGNTAFNAGQMEIAVWINSEANQLYKTEFLNNIFVSTDDNPNRLSFDYSASGLNFDSSGVYRNNMFIRPDKNEKIRIKNFGDEGAPAISTFSALQFETSRPTVFGTTSSPVVFKKEDVFLFYNDSEATKEFNLESGKIYIDMNGNAYCSSITLEPFKSIVLLKYGEGNCDNLNSTISIPTNFTKTNITDAKVDLQWNTVVAAINYDIRYKLLTGTSWKYANNIITNNISISNLAAETQYEVQIRTCGIGVKSDWSTSLFYTTESTEMFFVNANQFNLYPSSAFGTVWQEGTPAIWVNRFGITNGTMDGNYYENVKEKGGIAPDVYMLVEQALDPTKLYDIYLYYVSPTQQFWSVRAKLESDTNFRIFNRETEGALQIPDKDGNVDRLYRAFIGTVRGSTDFRVDISADPQIEVLRSVFDGVGYQLSSNQQSGLFFNKNNSSFIVYPNPVKDFLRIKSDNVQQLHTTIEVYSALGQHQQCPVDLTNNEIIINVQTLAKGYYFVRLITENGIFSAKFSK